MDALNTETTAETEATLDEQFVTLATDMIFQAGVDLYNSSINQLANTKSLEESGQ